MHQRDNLARARASERVPEGNGAATWIDLFWRQPELLHTIHGLKREGEGAGKAGGEIEHELGEWEEGHWRRGEGALLLVHLPGLQTLR